MTRPFTIVCLSTQEWEAVLPTNRQQIMLRAAARGHAVLFVESGAFLGRHLARLLRRPSLARELLGAVEVAPGIHVRKALNVLPWGHSRRLPNRINARLTAAAIRRSARRLPGPRVLWLYDPCAAPLIGSCGERVALYDCVDDYAAIEGTSRATGELLEAMDADCAAHAGVVATTTRSLHERHRTRNGSTHLVRNAGDYAHFSAAVEPAIRDLPRPVVGFAGNLHPGKVDFDLLDELVARRPEWTFVLVGPVQPAAAARVAALTAAANVRHVGHVPYAELPAYVAAFDVALIPYVANRYTRSCFPLKLYEYLAAGKPVVASGLPELAGMEPDVALADGCDAFEAAVVDALSSRDGVERRMAVAAANTWEGRAATLLGLVDSALAAR